MDLANKVAQMAKRALPVSAAFDELIRAIGESKSKSEEDAIVGKLVELCRQKIREGRREPRTQKELLVYLIYIEMLGHDTAWAQATAIQLCGDKNLAVKKLAYLAVSLLLDPASELSIMVVATIQADLRSDNFLTVCTALSGICHIVSPELVGVFQPQVLALLRHERDLVKKKALLALQRFLQVDPGTAPDLERHLIDKIGHKEPAVMVAALCGLRELIRADPAPYRNLVHYFTNILKQAAEGKLGRAYEYHRAPAPFVQLELLRLLALLGAGDRAASENMYAVVAEVKRRAEPLGNNIGNAVVYECIRTLAAIHPSPALLAGAAESVARFLAARENNLRYAGIDALERLARLDPQHAQAHQLAVVDCLRSPDATLKRKTLQLLYRMAGPANIDVVAAEVLGYLREAAGGGGGDERARRDAAATLADLAERYAPDHRWFVDTLGELFEAAGDVVPPSLADSLTRLIAEGTGEEDEAADREFRAAAVASYLEALARPKLPRVLLKVICWVVGEYGRLSGEPVERVMDRLAAVPETQAADDEVRGWVVTALGKLAAQAGVPLAGDAAALVGAASRAESVALQQAALEAAALAAAAPATRHAALPHDAAAEDVRPDPALAFLEPFVAQALQAGAAPHLSLEDRLAMGMTREGGAPLAPHHGAHALRFEAYAHTPAPRPAPMLAVGAPAAPPDLDFGGLALSQPAGGAAAAAGGAPAAQAAAPAAPAAPAAAEPQLVLNKPGRKWGGPAPAEPPAQAAAPGQQQYGAGGAAAPAAGSASPARGGAPPPAADEAKQRLAASLFGGGGGGPSASPGLRGRRAAASPAKPTARPATDAPDLLGGMEAEAAPTAAAAGPPGSDLDLLMGLGAPAAAAGPLDPMAALAALGGGGGQQQAQPAAAPGPQVLPAGLGDLLGNGGALGTPPPPQPALAGIDFGLDLLGGGGTPPRPQQPAPAPQQAGAPRLGSGAPMAGGSRLLQGKKDPFADLLG